MVRLDWHDKAVVVLRGFSTMSLASCAAARSSVHLVGVSFSEPMSPGDRQPPPEVHTCCCFTGMQHSVTACSGVYGVTQCIACTAYYGQGGAATVPARIQALMPLHAYVSCPRVAHRTHHGCVYRPGRGSVPCNTLR
ncbi:hypothetical protein COO60DRAFT_558669 [Scenedesmus sp. NREL 46B-D3]|nr:hypothetical protein COO60DRAFT_558669 [Scenedesmus sp. NREL 46B-D3]